MKSKTRNLTIILGILTVIVLFYDFTVGIVIAFFSAIIVGIGFTKSPKKNQSLGAKRQPSQTLEDFSFEIAVPYPLINECSTGEYVNWWRNPENSRKIGLYKQDYFMGAGKLGEVPYALEKKVNRLIDAGHELTFTVDGHTVFCSIKPYELIQKERDQRSADKKARLEELFSKDYRPQKPIEIRIDHHLENYKPATNPNIQVVVYDKETYLENHEKLFVDFIVDGEKFRNDTTYQQLLKIIRAHHSGYEFSAKVKRSQFRCFDIVLTPHKKESSDQGTS